MYKCATGHGAEFGDKYRPRINNVEINIMIHVVRMASCFQQFPKVTEFYVRQTWAKFACLSLKKNFSLGSRIAKLLNLLAENFEVYARTSVERQQTLPPIFIHSSIRCLTRHECTKLETRAGK